MVLPAVCKVFNRWRRETSRPAPDAVRIGLVRADDLTGAEVLDPENVDLADLALALEDHSEEHAWWFDPATGETAPRFMPDGEEPVPDAGDRLIPVDPLPSSVGYADMEDFIAGVRDPRARDRLERAIAGRSAASRTRCSTTDSCARPGSPSTTPAASNGRSSGCSNRTSWTPLPLSAPSRGARRHRPKTSQA
jgi:hypothetical protein